MPYGAVVALLLVVALFIAWWAALALAAAVAGVFTVNRWGASGQQRRLAAYRLRRGRFNQGKHR